MTKILVYIILLCPAWVYAQKQVLDKGFKNQEGSSEVAVVAINSSTNQLYFPLAQSLADLFREEKGYNTNPSFFNSDFVADGIFDKLFNAEKYKIKKLKLEGRIDFICLAKYTLKSTSVNDYGLYNADIFLQIRFVSATSGVIADSRDYTMKGAGISKENAETNAIERILNQLK